MGTRFAQTFLGRQVGLWQPTCRVSPQQQGEGGLASVMSV